MSPTKPSPGIVAGSVLRAQPDGRLLTLAEEGSKRAVEEIVRRYRPALLRYAASIVPSDRADDVVQDSLARALPRIESGGGDLHLRAWLYTIVRNTALNNLRDAGPPHEQLDESYDGVEQPPQALERGERLRALVAGLHGLPEPQREALVKREMEGMSHSQIALALGVSAGAARQLIFRGRSALRDGLGVLVPMPVVRQLVEQGSAAEAGAAGGGALALKATAAILATGAAVTAGVAVRASHHQDHRPAVAERAGGVTGSGAGAAKSRGERASVPAGGDPATRGEAAQPAVPQALGAESVSAGQDPSAKPTAGDGAAGVHRTSRPTHTDPSGGSLGGAGLTAGGRDVPAADGGSVLEDSSESDGGAGSGGTSSGSGDVESTTVGGDGSSSGDGSSGLSTATQTETTSGDSLVQEAGDG